MSGLEAIIGLAAVATAVVFAIGFRFGLTQVRLRDAARSIPRAVIASGDARWTAGQGRQRWVDRVPTFQAALVAVGVTSIFLMALCFVAIVVVIVIGS
jgi:hypothetical protein